MLREIGISGPQRVVLRLVTLAPRGLGPGEIARRMRHHAATISTLLNRLEEAGYVERRQSGEDRRRWTVVATRRGRALGARTQGTIEEIVGQVIGRLDPEDVRRCLAVLDALEEALTPGGEE